MISDHFHAIAGEFIHNGITKAEWFAGQALIGLLAQHGPEKPHAIGLIVEEARVIGLAMAEAMK